MILSASPASRARRPAQPESAFLTGFGRPLALEAFSQRIKKMSKEGRAFLGPGRAPEDRTCRVAYLFNSNEWFWIWNPETSQSVR